MRLADVPPSGPGRAGRCARPRADLDARALLAERVGVDLERGEPPVVVQLGERDACLRAGRGRARRRGGRPLYEGHRRLHLQLRAGLVVHAGRRHRLVLGHALGQHVDDDRHRARSAATSRKVSAQATVGASQTIPDPSIWNYLYTDNKNTCFTLQGGSTVAVPLYTQGPVCITGGAHFTGSDLEVGGSLTIGGGSNIGTSSSKIAKLEIAGTCSQLNTGPAESRLRGQRAADLGEHGRQHGLAGPDDADVDLPGTYATQKAATQTGCPAGPARQRRHAEQQRRLGQPVPDEQLVRLQGRHQRAQVERDGLLDERAPCSSTASSTSTAASRSAAACMSPTPAAGRSTSPAP